MSACDPKRIAAAAGCLTELLTSSPLPRETGMDAGPAGGNESTVGQQSDGEDECSLYVASDHLGMDALLAAALPPRVTRRCRILTATSFEDRLHPELAADIRAFTNYTAQHGHSRWWGRHAATQHEVGSANGHPLPWADPIDLAVLSNAQAVMGVAFGPLASTLAYAAGTRVGRYYYLEPVRAGGGNYTSGLVCRAASVLYPSDQNEQALRYARLTAAGADAVAMSAGNRPSPRLTCRGASDGGISPTPQDDSGHEPETSKLMGMEAGAVTSSGNQPSRPAAGGMSSVKGRPQPDMPPRAVGQSV